MEKPAVKQVLFLIILTQNFKLSSNSSSCSYIIALNI